MFAQEKHICHWHHLPHYFNLYSFSSDFCLFTLYSIYWHIYTQHQRSSRALGPSLCVRLIITILRSVAFPVGRLISDKARVGTHTHTYPLSNNRQMHVHTQIRMHTSTHAPLNWLISDYSLSTFVPSLICLSVYLPLLNITVLCCPISLLLCSLNSFSFLQKCQYTQKKTQICIVQGKKLV